MINRTCLSLLSLLLCGSSFAAQIVTETRNGDTLVAVTKTYANAAGDLRIDEYSVGLKTMTSAEDGASSAKGGTSPPETEQFVTGIDDTTIFQVNGEAIVSVEVSGKEKVCRHLTADSESPLVAGAAGTNLGDLSKQYADVMKQVGPGIEKAMADAKREGMDAETERALDQFTKGFLDPEAIKPREALEAKPLGQRVRVGSYNADGYSIVDQDDIERHRIFVVSTDLVNGGADVQRAMMNMFNVYEKYLDKMGGAALMETGLPTLFRDGPLAGKIAVLIEDIQADKITEVTVVTETHSGVPPVDFFYPKDCTEKKGMFEM